MEAGLATLSHLAVSLVCSSRYALYESAHVLVSSSAWLHPFGTYAKPEHSGPECCSGWKQASPLCPTLLCHLYVAADMLYMNLLMSSFLPRPGCTHLAHMPNLSTQDLSAAQDGSGPRHSIPP